MDAALSLHRKALDINRRLLAATPSSRPLRKQLLDSVSYVANVLKDVGDTAGALAAYRHAAAEVQTLCPTEERDQWCHEHLADTHTSLGIALSDAGEMAGAATELRRAVVLAEGRLAALRRPADAAAQYAEALAISTALEKEDPGRAETRRDLAQVHALAGALSLQSGRGALAAQQLGTALQLYTAAATADPANAALQRGLAKTRQLLANLR